MKTSEGEDDDQLKSRVDKLERAFQSVIRTSHPQTPSIKTHTQTGQLSHRQNAGEMWNSNRSWNPRGQASACQQEHPHFPCQPEPYPNATRIPTWQMGYQDDNPYPGFQNYDPSQPVYQPNYTNHYPHSQNYLHQPWLSNAEDHLPTRPSEDWQAQNPLSYQSQVYPSQDQHNSYPQQTFDLPLNTNQHEGSIEEKIEGLIISQQSMRSCLQSNDELTLGIQNAHDELKASMDEMIRRASQLADIMRKMQEDRERSRADEHWLDEMI